MSGFINERYSVQILNLNFNLLITLFIFINITALLMTLDGNNVLQLIYHFQRP